MLLLFEREIPILLKDPMFTPIAEHVRCALLCPLSYNKCFLLRYSDANNTQQYYKNQKSQDYLYSTVIRFIFTK